MDSTSSRCDSTPRTSAVRLRTLLDVASTRVAEMRDKVGTDFRLAPASRVGLAPSPTFPDRQGGFFHKRMRLHRQQTVSREPSLLKQQWILANVYRAVNLFISGRSCAASRQFVKSVVFRTDFMRCRARNGCRARQALKATGSARGTAATVESAKATPSPDYARASETELGPPRHQRVPGRGISE